MYSVVVVDDHSIFRAGIIAMLDPDRFVVVAETDDCQSAVDLIIQNQPDVVLLDVHLGNAKGADVIERVNMSQIQNGKRTINFLALSVSDSKDDVFETVKAGALGYVTKTIERNELNHTLEQVANGYTIFSPKLAGFVLSSFQNNFEADLDVPNDNYHLLTNKEKVVLRYIARGYSYKDVAKNMTISQKTVETHMSHILKKLQFSSRHQISQWASEKGIV